jgi:hypothetical protein
MSREVQAGTIMFTAMQYKKNTDTYQKADTTNALAPEKC